MQSVTSNILLTQGGNPDLNQFKRGQFYTKNDNGKVLPKKYYLVGDEINNHKLDQTTTISFKYPSNNIYPEREKHLIDWLTEKEISFIHESRESRGITVFFNGLSSEEVEHLREFVARLKLMLKRPSKSLDNIHLVSLVVK